MLRKVLISPGYGAGWSTWNTTYGHARELALDPELIQLVESKQHLGKCTGYELHSVGVEDADDRDWPQRGDTFPASISFAKRAWEVNGRHPPCLLGVKDLRIIEVDGAFRVTEYDGFEAIDYADKDWW